MSIDLRGRLDSENHAFHDADKMIGKAEVGGERDDGPGHSWDLTVRTCLLTVILHWRQNPAADHHGHAWLAPAWSRMESAH